MLLERTDYCMFSQASSNLRAMCAIEVVGVDLMLPPPLTPRGVGVGLVQIHLQ